MGKIRIILYLLLIIVSLLCSYFLRDYVFLFGTQKLTTKPIFILTSICAVIIIVYIILMLIFKKFNPNLYKRLYNVLFESEEEFDGEKYINDLRDKIIIFKEDNKEKNKDILELMLENMKEIKDYYVISKRQSNRSFTLAVSMCVVGLCFIATSIVLAFVADLSIGVTLIPAIGGSIAELIAGTALIVYRSSVEQLNNYYKALHNNERFLSLVNLVSKVSPEKQDDVYINIINTELQNYRMREN